MRKPKVGDEFVWMGGSEGQWDSITETICDVICPVDGGWLVEYPQTRLRNLPSVFANIPNFGAPRVSRCVIVDRDGKWLHELRTPDADAGGEG